MRGEIDYIHSLREAELNQALVTLTGRDGRLLEIGGGDGWQASLLARRFAAVESVDVDVPECTWFPVQRYDGRQLPFSDGSFDVVFSSHVMEHIPHFARLQGEIARVLKPGGVALHIVPSVSWRFWTLLAHYPALPKLALAWFIGQRMPGSAASGTAGGTGYGRHGIGWWLRRVLLAVPHGAMGSALGELKGFSHRAWLNRFADAGWRVINSAPGGYFYTGYVLFGSRLGLSARAVLGRILGSCSTYYLVEPAERVAQDCVQDQTRHLKGCRIWLSVSVQPQLAKPAGMPA